MSFTIRKAELRDLGPALQLDRDTFGVDAWTVLDYSGVFSFHGVKKFTATVDGKFAGFAASEWDPKRKAVCLMTLAVRPEFRGRGIGLALLKECENAFDEINYYLNVDIANTAAIRLYQIAGYQQTGIEPAYYMNGHDALIMEKIKKQALTVDG